MKSFAQFLKESSQQIMSLEKLTAIYDCPADLYIEVPKSFSESDIQIYMDDILLDNMPGNSENAEKFFFSNAQYINDVHFEYDSIQQSLANNQKADIPFKEGYTNKGDGENVIMQLKNLKYVIEFEEFKIDNVGKDDTTKIREILTEIFNSSVSNNENSWSITTTINPDNIKFDSIEEKNV